MKNWGLYFKKIADLIRVLNQRIEHIILWIERLESIFEKLKEWMRLLRHLSDRFHSKH